jgi:hypothetical protein
MSAPTALAAAALVALSAFASSPSLACSVCQAGDPLYSAGAATPEEAGSYSAYLELQGWRKTSGLLIEEAGEPPEEGREVNKSQSLTLFLSGTPIDRFSFTLALPWRFNTITESPAGEDPQTNHLNGFGDAALTLGYVLWRDRDVLPENWVEARLFGKAPTGPNDRTTKGVLDPHLQPGTGSWDWGTGLSGGHHFAWGSFYASAFWRFNQPGALNYEYGDLGLVTLALDAPIGHLFQRPVLDFLTGAFEFNYRYAERDRYLGQTYADSGGSVFYVTPSVRIRIPWFGGMKAPQIRLSAQCPLGDKYLYGQQHEGIVWSTGLLFRF